jgi:hypothetical protein
MQWLKRAALITIVAGCGGQNGARMDDASPAPSQEAHNQLTAQERQQGWRLLFDGTTTNGWRNYNGQGLRDGWQVVDGAFTRVAQGGDIITNEQYENFDLTLDWKLREGGNSGVFFNVVEQPGAVIYHGAPEVQILDDTRHPDGRNELTSAGANYALHPAPRGVVKPVGDWNTMRIRKNGDHVEQWLNGQKIVEYDLGSEDWKKRVAASKFSAWPSYGQARRGYIGLQDHGNWVAFRNIKIRVLP